MTAPLWGVGTTAPYGHDGRSIKLEDVILRHGGEAQTVAQRVRGAARDADRRAIIEFLNTLVLFPPDDTASNLDPGDPDADGIRSASTAASAVGAVQLAGGSRVGHSLFFARSIPRTLKSEPVEPTHVGCRLPSKPIGVPAPMSARDPLHAIHVRADRLMVGVLWCLAILSFALAPWQEPGSGR